jgi:L-cystine uptake protein TcyP (sodium:dicarboxylate symporter family)
VWIENFEYKKNFGLYVKGVEETLDNNRVEAQLTIEGLDYAINLRREREQHESIISTNQSVETTNKSTRNLNEKILPNNFRSQRTGNRWSRILAGISVAFIAITAFLQYHDKSAQKTQELKQEVKETSKTLKEVKTSLQEINYSMKNVTTDTILVRRRK